MLKGFKKNQKGFTLIELLIVIAILGILAAIAIPAISSMTKSASVGAANAELASVQTASMAYYADEDKYPSTSGDLAGYLSTTVKLVNGYTITDGVVIPTDAVGETGLVSVTYDQTDIQWNVATSKFVK